MSKGISLTFSISTRHTNKKLAQTRLHHRRNTHNLRHHSNNISVLVRNMGQTSDETSHVDLVDEDEEEEEHIRQCARWTHDEEILLTECWIKTFENGQIGADRTEDSFWRQIMDDFNSGTTQGYRTRHMLTGKWSRINGDCQSSTLFTNILNVKVRKMRRMISRLQRSVLQLTTNGRKFQLEHVGGCASGSTSDFVYEDLRRKLQAGTSAYEAKKQKELAMMEFKEMKFLTIDVDQLPEPKASII
uniref:Glutathione S-transferase T3-like n=1 Tax=Tanacetum cinerariifolium TaxID=118510 RepID=A0A699GSN2_TANCI|nr:hypothetical protein [Tanacetum cinerariifolium]